MNNISLVLKAISGIIDFNNLPRDQRQITFYSEGKNYWPHLEGLLNAVLEQTNFFVSYISSSVDDPGLKVSHSRLKTYFIGFGFIRDYLFKTLDTDIMVMTMPDLHQYQLKRSNHDVHYLYVQHSLVSLHMIYRHGAFDHYDTICCAGPHHVQEVLAIEKRYNLPPKNIIELGYSRLDSLIKESKCYPKTNNHDEARKFQKVLIAPSWGPEGLIESGLVSRLVDELLKFDHEVVLRPHPQTLKFASNKVEQILNRHNHNPHFYYEDSVADQNSLHQSDIMVSDWSGSALEYAFGLKKPIIFCDVPKKVNNPNYHDIDLVPLEVSIRDKIGTIWDGRSPIINCLKEIGASDKSYLQFLGNKYVFNIENSCNVFSKKLAELI